MAQMPKYDTGDDSLVEEASQLLRSTFQSDTDKAVCCMAPGRVNLIGEHTDYNEGFVMPLALKLRTIVVAVPTTTGVCRIASINQPGDIREINMNDNAPGKVGGWGKYVAGVIAQYTGELPTDGKFSFDAAFASNVPLGAGLSSSASLEVCTATLLQALVGISDDVVSGVDKALRCVQAEHVYANVPCGIMDQFISAMGKEDHLLLVDCRTNKPKAVPFLDKDVAIVVCNTNVTHSLDGSEYPDRVKQCKQAVEAIKQLAEKDADASTLAALPSITHLRDVTPDMVQNAFDKGSIDEVVYKRAMHGTTEDQRTLKAADALFESDYSTVGELMKQSHKSLSEDYQVSTIELDALVEIAIKVEGVFGSRMTGGGFGGSTVTLVKASQVDALINQLEKEYNPKFGINCSCMSTRPGAGAGVVFDRREGNATATAVADVAAADVAAADVATPVAAATPGK